MFNFYSIGSLGRSFNEDGVENVTVINSVFSGSNNGLRIKTWARPSKGFVRNISFRNIVMKNVENPIIIDQNYCPTKQGCPSQVNILFQKKKKSIFICVLNKHIFLYNCLPHAYLKTKDWK